MYDLGSRIRKIRVQRGLTQKELARRINKSKSAICGYETNAQMPPLDVIVSIASVLNVPLNYLAGYQPVESISTDGLSGQQKRIIDLLLAEFMNPTNSSPSLSENQIAIIRDIICLFCGYPQSESL